jgi:hypothetical protein
MRTTLRCSLNQRELAERNRLSVTAMSKLLAKWCREDLAKGVVHPIIWSLLTFSPEDSKQPATTPKTSSVSATPATLGHMHSQKPFGKWSKDLLEKDVTPLYLKGVKDDIHKIPDNQDTHYPANREVQLLQKRSHPCSDCPLTERDTAGADSLREAFKTVRKRAGKRAEKAKR